MLYCKSVIQCLWSLDQTVRLSGRRRRRRRKWHGMSRESRLPSAVQNACSRRRRRKWPMACPEKVVCRVPCRTRAEDMYRHISTNNHMWSRACDKCGGAAITHRIRGYFAHVAHSHGSHTSHDTQQPRHSDCPVNEIPVAHTVAVHTPLPGRRDATRTAGSPAHVSRGPTASPLST